MPRYPAGVRRHGPPIAGVALEREVSPQVPVAVNLHACKGAHDLDGDDGKGEEEQIHGKVDTCPPDALSMASGNIRRGFTLLL